ncbi:MAG TPA: hypothetical protein VEA69_10250 [Tepidisphaeraceae bacterium]|nr:hypothetical protein [Tepidisphaeraceae bacterium]
MTLLRTLALAAVLGFALPTTAQQKNIFDDDWQAPKATPAEAKPTRPPAPPPDKPAPPIAPPPTTTDPAPKVAIVPGPPPVARRPVPAEPQQAAVRKVMKQVFARQLTDRTPAGRKALFAALVAQADKSADLPVERFVLLAAAHDAAVEAGDLTLVARAADDLGRHFDVDALAVQAAAAPAVLRPGIAPRDAIADNVRAALALARQLATAGDYEAAVKVALAAAPAAAASGDAPLRTQATAAVRDLSALRDAAARISKDLDRLATSPDDPAANLAVGKHWCFDLASWPAGLAKLAKGSDPALKALAAQELAGPRSAEQLATLAEAWWEVGAKLTDGLAKSNVAAHSADLYRRALPTLAGLKKQLAERRIAQADTLTEATGAPARTSAAGAGRVAGMFGVYWRDKTALPLYATFVPDGKNVQGPAAKAALDAANVEWGRRRYTGIGWVDLPRTGAYQVTASPAVTVFVDNAKLALDNYNKKQTVSFELKAGVHEVRIEVGNNGGQMTATMVGIADEAGNPVPIYLDPRQVDRLKKATFGAAKATEIIVAPPPPVAPPPTPKATTPAPAAPVGQPAPAAATPDTKPAAPAPANAVRVAFATGGKTELGTLADNATLFHNRKYTFERVPAALRQHSYTRRAGGFKAHDVTIDLPPNAVAHVVCEDADNTDDLRKTLAAAGWQRVGDQEVGEWDNHKPLALFRRQAGPTPERVRLTTANFSGAIVVAESLVLAEP